MMGGGAIVGCGPELPIEYETEHLRIGTDLEYPLCQGDLVTLESRISRIENELGAKLDHVQDVYIWPEEVWWSGPNRVCRRELANGCTDIEGNTMYATDNTLGHELVHAIMGRTDVSPFFEEGICEIYSGTPSRFGPSAPSANQGVSYESWDRTTGRHFIRWLREYFGPELLGELVRMKGDGFDNFADVYGMSFAVAEALYFEDAPIMYPSLYTCAGAELPPVTLDRGWVAQIPLDCEDGEDTRVSGLGMRVHRTFVVEQAGYYTFNFDGYWFDIYRCSPDRVDVAPGELDWLQDVPAAHASYPDAAFRHYEGAGVRDLYMEAGRHDIGVGLLGYGAGVTNLSITPALGPHPAPQD
jgi:hypothetical protein